MNVLNGLCPLILSASMSVSGHFTEKLCTVTSQEFNGYEMRVSISPNSIVVSPYPPNNNAYLALGDFPNMLGTRVHKGVRQIGYHGVDEGDGHTFWVDEALLLP